MHANVRQYEIKAEENYARNHAQNESASMPTVLYCVTMIQIHAQTQFWVNFEITKCCGYLEYKVKVIKIG